mmetsp:Transcript_4514/g.10830  ORF Transcript_4514/g.10830 Transcript_4514/m.10830 type:complete len:128 (-) Transcript_4514:607-990(-)
MEVTKSFEMSFIGSDQMETEEEERTVGPDEEIVRYGANIEGFYLLLAGECEMTVWLESDMAVRKRISIGETFLMPSAVMRMQESVIEVKSITDCKLLRIPSASLSSIPSSVVFDVKTSLVVPPSSLS